MSKKTLGYTELFWTCPNCGGKNRGTIQTCEQCGAPQPEDVQFEQLAESQISQDESLAQRAKAGPDIHCPYCGTRNPATAKVCKQCGGDISEGTRRESGRVVGAFKSGTAQPVLCPACKSPNPPDANVCSNCGAPLGEKPESPKTAAPAPKKKSRLPLVLLVVFVMMCLIAGIFMVLSNRTDAITGTVTAVSWNRTISIEGLVAVENQAWLDEIPEDAEVLGCEQEVRSIEPEPVAGAEEVCGTPYTVDTGSGVGEVVQDCEYYIYDQYCTYTTLAWQPVDQVSVSGSDLTPYWPEAQLSANQRLGEQSETYTIYFDANGETYTFSTSDFELFQQCEIGSQWTLNVNTFGNVTSISP